MTQNEIRELFCRPVDERSLLRFCFKNVDFFYTISSKMEAEDFLHPDHIKIYLLMCSLQKKGIVKFDLHMVVDEAREAGILKEIGGYEYLTSIARLSVSDENFDIILQNVLETSTKFKLYLTLEKQLSFLMENAKAGADSASIIGRVENSILDLSTASKAIKEPKDIAVGLVDLFDERRKNEIKYSGIDTGFPILTRQIDGMVPGTLMIVAARKKMGKSSFLMNMAAHIAYIEKYPTLYIDTEMTFNQFRDRLIASMTGVEERVIKHGGYTDEQYRVLVQKCLKYIKDGYLFHEYMPGYSVDKVVALYKKFKIKHNIGFGVFDYLKEPDSSSLDRQRKEYQILGDVTTKLKDLAGELEIPFLTAVQLNRQHDVADSDRIARYGDIVAFWQNRTEEEKERGKQYGTHKLVIKDTRRGGSTSEAGIGYHFFKSRLKIKETVDQLIEYREGEVYNSDSSNDEEYMFNGEEEQF